MGRWSSATSSFFDTVIRLRDGASFFERFSDRALDQYTAQDTLAAMPKLRVSVSTLVVACSCGGTPSDENTQDDTRSADESLSTERVETVETLSKSTDEADVLPDSEATSDSEAPSTDTDTAMSLASPRDSANIYWVGHSLMSHTDSEASGSHSLLNLLSELTPTTGDSYSFYKHTTPGAPIGWNWGHDASSYNSQLIAPLLDTGDSRYGTFDTIVVTEGIALQPSYDWWNSSYYARRFFCAARAANPNAELYLYESWHHFQASDTEYSNHYGEPEDYDFVGYMNKIRSLWETIAHEAGTPSASARPDGYTYQGPGEDPGECDDTFEVRLVPTGTALVALLDRLDESRGEDDWSYPAAASGDEMSPVDLFQNPFSDFPSNTNTTVHGGMVDDIHPSHLLVYLNSAVHYAMIYRKDPRALATANDVPEGIASIMREIAWDVVESELN